METEREITEVIEEELVPCLHKKSIEESCCIFRVPPLLLETNARAFRPSIVAVGPYHSRDEKRLQMIEHHKPRFVALFLETTNRNDVSMTMISLKNIVGELENEIRDSYSEPLQLSREELVKMMVLDGCLILMLMLVNLEVVTSTNPNDTIFTLPWIVPTLRRDLLLLENQVPYTLLETLFRKMGLSPLYNLSRFVCTFFQSSLWFMSEKVLEKAEKSEPKHLLHLIQETLTPSTGYKTRGERSSGEVYPEFILSAERLQLQGIEFKIHKEAETIMDIELESNKILIPSLILDQFRCTVLLNGVAFEQSSRLYGDNITSYIMLMGFLMKEKRDALFMSNKKIVQNCFGTYEEASGFFKDICKSVDFKLSESYLAHVYEGINLYTSKRRTGYWADLKRSYIGSPVVILATIGAIILLVMGLSQNGIALLSYLNDLKGNQASPPS